MSAEAIMTKTAADPYPSRGEPRARWMGRLDPVIHPGGETFTRLSSGEIDSFAKQGFLFQNHLFQPGEVSRLNEELRRLTASEEIKNSEASIAEPESLVVRSIFRVHRFSRVFEELARDRRLLDAARQILGSEVYLHQTRLNLKPGFSGKEFYWHSDFETWHVEDGMPRMRAVSVSIALTDNFPYNGPLMVIPGSHKTYIACVGETPDEHYKQSLKRQEYGVPDQESLRKLAGQGGIEAPTGPAGSALFFDCNTMHGSGSNISPYPRSNVFFVYNSVENTLIPPYRGLKPRPEHIAARESFEPLAALPA